jgi:hypothetical protein
VEPEPPAAGACTHCGAQVDAQSEYCANCGTRLDDAVPPQPQAALAPATATERQSGCVVVGLGVIAGAVVGAPLALAVSMLGYSVAERSKIVSAAVFAGMLALIALLVVLVVSVERRRAKTPLFLRAFVVAFAIVCGGGLGVCSTLLVPAMFMR